MPVPEYIQNIRQKIGHELVMLVGAAAIIINQQGEVLLQRRSDNGNWGVIGGAVEPGEEPAEAVIREAWEEAGVHVIPERIVGVYGGPDYRFTYPNGDEVSIVSITFLCRIISGEPHINDDESLELRFFSPDNLPVMEFRHRERVEQALKNDSHTFFRLPD